MVSGKTKSRMAFFISGVAIIAIAALLSGAYLLHLKGADTPPGGDASEVAALDGDGFPAVDWEYWRSVNPDVIGWVTVPGTPIDYPIVQARADAPQYYLTHDVYGNWNYVGCPYLDAANADGGLFGSQNAVVFAHNMGNGDMAMFGAFGSYSDAEYAREHERILVQTPTEKRVLRARFTRVLNGAELAKRTDFEGQADYSKWYEDSLASAVVILDGQSRPARCVTFCTCSYNYWSNERTITVASVDAAGAAMKGEGGYEYAY